MSKKLRVLHGYPIGEGSSYSPDTDCWLCEFEYPYFTNVYYGVRLSEAVILSCVHDAVSRGVVGFDHKAGGRGQQSRRSG
jgi:hypothetical protein